MMSLPYLRKIVNYSILSMLATIIRNHTIYPIGLQDINAQELVGNLSILQGRLIHCYSIIQVYSELSW